MGFLQKSRVENVELLFPFTSLYTPEYIHSQFLSHGRVKEICVYSCPEEAVVKYNESKSDDKFINLYYTDQRIDSSNHCGYIYPTNFVIHNLHFFESQKFNNCLNKKISIDINGNIMNCPSMKTKYGTLENTKLEDVIKKDDFTKIWSINKDSVEKCKDCEFRYVCSDCRAFTEDNDLNKKPLHCKYNPYTAEWED